MMFKWTTYVSFYSDDLSLNPADFKIIFSEFCTKIGASMNEKEASVLLGTRQLLVCLRHRNFP